MAGCGVHSEGNGRGWDSATRLGQVTEILTCQKAAEDAVCGGEPRVWESGGGAGHKWV